ncbi:hypothetical protein Mapa_014660 [Marchantia paleacea]|nr:hypothetical protein Mapa_014660 [Marchantia paleacea]
MTMYRRANDSLALSLSLSLSPSLLPNTASRFFLQNGRDEAPPAPALLLTTTAEAEEKCGRENPDARISAAADKDLLEHIRNAVRRVSREQESIRVEGVEGRPQRETQTEESM